MRAIRRGIEAGHEAPTRSGGCSLGVGSGSSLKAWLLLLPAILLLAMAAAATFLAWQGFTLLNRDDLATSETAAAIQGLAAALSLAVTVCLVGVTAMVRVPCEQADQARRAERVNGVVHRLGRSVKGRDMGTQSVSHGPA